MKKVLLTVVAAALFAVLYPVAASSQVGSGIPLDYLGHRSYSGFTRLVFDTGFARPETFTINYEEASRRVIFDPRQGTVAFSFEPVKSVDQTVHSIDYIQVAEGRLGVIVKLGKDAVGFRVSYLDEPKRLVLDIYRQSKFRLFLPFNRDIKRVAIDPGHGGMMAGVVGVDALSEAALTYELSLKLAEMLEDRGIATVITRGEDASPTSDERVGVANSAKADMFVSLHMSGQPGVRVITYDEGMLDDRKAPDTGLLWSDQHAPYLPECLRLAKVVSGRLGNAGLGRPEMKSVRLAGFEGLAMPGVFVEFGGLSGGGSKLADDAYLDRLAALLADGILSYAGGR